MGRRDHHGRQLALALGFLVAMMLLGATWLSSASAETHTKTKKPGKPTPSAGATAAAPATGSSAPVASSAPTTGPVPAPRNEAGDGGVRSSPLNPTAEEMPGYVAPGASAPVPVPTVDYDKLVGDIAALRARVADVSDALFVSRIVLSVETDGDHAQIGRFTIELDDGVVYTAPASFHAPDPTTVYEHAVAPGHHAITIEVERKDDRDDTYRDTQRSRFIVDVPKDQRLAATLLISDDSDMAAKFPGDHHGTYDLRVRMKAVATPVKR